jgi:hypothetical protein
VEHSVDTDVNRSIVSPLLTELERIAGRVETERAAADQALICELRQEIAQLRAAVAHLRAGTAPLPGRLRPVVARAMTTAEPAPQPAL